MHTILVTGSAGFIGFHICRRLLNDGFRVIGLDCFSDYYDIDLKEARAVLLKENSNFKEIRHRIENRSVLLDLFESEQPEYVIHLAGQAGVRHSIDNPRAYMESNLLGTFELLEAARAFPPKHMLLASTSSAYGANLNMPYRETDKADFQVSFYAATKKAAENMAHSYSHLYNMPITMFRFFTVYGPWGRPDMALFKFTKGIIGNKKIDIYNRGKMYRDFTFVDDIVDGIIALINKAPNVKQLGKIKNDSLSPVAPFRVLNIGNTRKVYLLDFINALEKEIGKKAIRNYMPMQKGDVKMTLSDTSLLKKLTGYNPKTNYRTGIKKFLKWYLGYYTK